MSLSLRALTLPVMALALASTAACTVRPLYSEGAPLSTTGERSSTQADLASIAIKPVNTRYGQEVRNQLIFLFSGGAGEPAAARYSLTLTVASLLETSTTRQVSRGENEPSAATITMIADYTLTSSADGSVVGQGKRQITSSFDVPQQAFAEMRAERDAQNRAARELAELLRLAIAQDLSRS